MKVALYIRVSTREQIDNYSIPLQKERLEAFCKSKGWTIYDTYIDGGYSGSNIDRPGIQKILKELHNIDAVVVYKLDRLSRSQKDTLKLIEDYFLQSNVDFVSITESLDTSTPFGKAMIGILSVFAQLERETIAERMHGGLIKRAQEGYRVMGGDYDPSGYKRVNGELVTIPEEKAHIQALFDLYEQYHSITKVQAELKLRGFPVWRFRRYRDILTNKLYCGYVTFAGEAYEGRHEAFISEEQFDRVQALLSRHKGHNAHKAKQSLLSGLLVCGKCSEPFLTYSVKDKGRKYRYYICKARRFPSEFDEKCLNKNWNAQKLEEAVINELENLILNKKFNKKKSPTINYKAQEKKIDVKISRILDLYADGEIEKDVLNERVKRLNKEKEELLKKKEVQEKTNISDQTLDQYAIDLHAADFYKKQAIIRKLINKIVITGETLEINWNN